MTKLKLKILILIFYWMKNHMKIFWFMTFHTKLCLVQNLCVLYLIKLMGFLEIKMELNIWHYLALKNMMPFMIGLDILKDQKLVSDMFFLIIMWKSKLTHDNLPLEKIFTLHVIILIRPVFNKDQNHYYYNMFLQRCFFQLTKIYLQQNLFMAK